MSCDRRLRLFELGALAFFAAAAAGAQSSSPSYRLERSTLDGGGAISTSAGARVTASIGQESAIGTSSSFGSVVSSGFWSFAGSGLVPVVLTGRKNGSVPADPDWDWTGNAPPYEIHRSTDCSALRDGYLLSQGTRSWTDVAPPAAPLVCYSVFATAPGPIAPDGRRTLTLDPGGSFEPR